MEKVDASGEVTETTYLKNIDDEEVVASLVEINLQNIARTTGGRYIRMGTQSLDSEKETPFQQLFRDDIRPLAVSLRTRKIISREEAFQYPLGAALLLLLIEMLIIRRRGRSKYPETAPAAPGTIGTSGSAVGLLLALVLCCGATSAVATEPEGVADTSVVPADTAVQVETKIVVTRKERDAACAQAARLFRKGMKYSVEAERLAKDGKKEDAKDKREKAKAKFEEAQAVLDKWSFNLPDDPYLLYNSGIAAYKLGDYLTAESAWHRVAILGGGELKERATFQLGNAVFRQAYKLKESGQRSWDSAIMLYRRAEEYYEALEKSPNVVLRDNCAKNRAASRKEVVDIYLGRGGMHLEAAIEMHGVIKKRKADAKSWEMRDWVTKLVGEAEKAKFDFDALLEIEPGHKGALQFVGKVDELLEYGLLTKARSVHKEVLEAGSTMNHVWTMGKYQESLSLYEQVLHVNPDLEVAKTEMLGIKEATRDVCLGEAEIECGKAQMILREAIKEKKLLASLDALKGEVGTNVINQRTKLEGDLRLLRHRHPPEDPEEAIKHWLEALTDCREALLFVPKDLRTVEKIKGLTDTVYKKRLKMARNYRTLAANLPFTNDEEADAVVKASENVVRHFKRAQAMLPKKAGSLEAERLRGEKFLARAYMKRGVIYVDIADERAKTHLDRAVAFMEKARQDFNFAYMADESLTEAKNLYKKTDKDAKKMRMDLSKIIARRYKEEKENPGLIDTPVEDEMTMKEIEDELRDLTISEDSFDKDNTRPQPVNNW